MDSSQILKRYNLRNTPCRRTILQLFYRAQSALSHKQIEQHLRPDYNRVTIYRTLDSFLVKGLVHKVCTDSPELYYACCLLSCPLPRHNHNHLHFKCRLCEKTFCLPVELPALQLPEGYQTQETYLLTIGTCARCSASLSTTPAC